MISKSISLVFGFVVVLATVSQAWHDLHSLCQFIDEKLEASAKKDSDTVYNIAMEQIKSLSNILSRLAEAWEAVHRKQLCDLNFLKHIETINQCMPSLHKNMRSNLLEETHEYAAGCLNSSVPAEALKEALKKALEPMEQAKVEAVSGFLDESFLDKYYEHNKGLARDDFRNLDDWLWKLGATAGGPVLDALKAHHESRNKGVPFVDQIKMKPQLIEEELRRLIIEPCAEYSDAMYSLDLVFENIMHFIDFEGDQLTPQEKYFEHMKIFPKEFKDAIFRHRFCFWLIRKREDLVRGVADEFKKEY